eukprot:TRINITY_DN3562_c0_g1_i1.p1 TRINITY_DN3562_c0_g1~~TRINITY_DN3562_c0_g1_i1.p1  ORF type:complete len:313 (+),score=52.86 TRINITY_DN3562_c0_g1_i1:3-941(+)
MIPTIWRFTTRPSLLSVTRNIVQRMASTSSRLNPIVTGEWASAHLPRLRVIDGSWHMPVEKRDIYADFKKDRIPGAVLFDIDVVADKTTSLPHMLPTPEIFERSVGSMGIKETDDLLIYDQSTKYVASARVWWTFRVFGHKGRIYILEGGLPIWKNKNMPLESGERSTPSPVRYISEFNPSLVRSFSDMKDNISSHQAEVVDARASDRFHGTAPEPRPGLRSGHIPNSKNVPFTSIVDLQTGKFLPEKELVQRFEQAGVDLSRDIVTTCGSGVTASTVSLALWTTGLDSAVYDGSFSEWGMPDSGGEVASKK